MRSPSPVRIGWESVKANAVPTVVLWAMAGTMVAVYYLVPGVESALKPIGAWQERTGWGAAFANCAFFCGILPYAVYLCKGRSGPRHPLFTAVLQSVFAGLCGTACNCFFGLQTAWFGNGHDVRTLVLKTAVDQFVWTPFALSPVVSFFNAALGRWIDHSRGELSFGDFVRRDYLPNLTTGWCIWIPVILAVYAFPLVLQVQVLGCVSASWMIVCREIGVRR